MTRPPSQKRNRLKPSSAFRGLDAAILAHLSAGKDVTATAGELRAALTPDAASDVALRAALARLRRRALVVVVPRPVGTFGTWRSDGGTRFAASALGRASSAPATGCKDLSDLPNVVPGWGCCRCKTYNAALKAIEGAPGKPIELVPKKGKATCRFCGHERCSGGPS